MKDWVIAESTSQWFPSKVKEPSLHVEKPSLECLDLVSLCPNLRAVKSNASTSDGKQGEEIRARTQFPDCLGHGQSKQNLIPRS